MPNVWQRRAGGLGMGEVAAGAWPGRAGAALSAPVAVHRLRVTHVLLPVSALLRRADAAAVIVSALVAKARCGLGFRRIAAVLGRPGETVRGWLRRFAERAESVRSVFTVWLRAVDPDPVMPDAAGGVFADAVTVMAAVGAVIARRFALPTVSLAEAAVAMSGGRLLAPGWPDRRVQHESTLP